MGELKDLVSTGMLTGGGAIATIAAGFYYFRQYTSNQKADAANNETTVVASGATSKAIELLQSMLKDALSGKREAEDRADRFAKERNDAVTELGSMKTEIKFLREQVEKLSTEVSRLTAITERNKT